MTRRTRLSAGDLGRQAVAALLAHRLRAVLSATGIVCGIATVITAFAIGDGARRAALSEIGALGVDNIFVRAVAPPASNDRRRRPPAPELSRADLGAIADTLDGVVTVAASRSAPVVVTAGPRHASTVLAGLTPSWRAVAHVDVGAGRWLSDADDDAHRRVAVVGGGLARELFPRGDAIGSWLSTGGDWYLVVGTLRVAAGGGLRPAIERLDMSRAVLVPFAAMDASLGEGDGPDRVQEIGVRMRGPADVDRAATALVSLLARRHPDSSRYELVVPRQLLDARLRAQRTFDRVLVAIGALALVISGVGIMNIMLASVAERVQEIGVRRAFGARRSEIVAQFAAEAALLCVAGGVTGVPLGAALAGVVALAAGWPVEISPASVAIALALAAGVGLGFGIYPARVAAAIQPIDALRS